MSQNRAAACQDCEPASPDTGGASAGGGLCVRCPFCGQTVNAVLTPETITCPSCQKSAPRR